MNFQEFQVPYPIDHQYQKKAAYFSMEYAISQPLKIYSGGLGFLSGSHLRSAYELRQNLIGIGILWKYGYYDQARNPDQTLQVQWNEKIYNYLEDTGIKFQIPIHGHSEWHLDAHHQHEADHEGGQERVVKSGTCDRCDNRFPQ